MISEASKPGCSFAESGAFEVVMYSVAKIASGWSLIL